ncbi:hypothetical protein [Bifidobacterium sp. UBA4282]|uniref:hypothetical protein n=1 Tax=Bifidobacterium sp. UBA4282 TaxID=1946096 RepID=UPI0025BF0228|nr:hypothetical protein [Bifidobacterium sp. UBA4282]
MTPEQEYVAQHDSPEVGWTRESFMAYVDSQDWTAPELEHLAAWTAKKQAEVLRRYGFEDGMPMFWSAQMQDELAARMGLPTPQNDPDVINDPWSNPLFLIHEEIIEVTRDYDPDEPIDDIDEWYGQLISDESIRYLTGQTE